jgi:hypothetical protein
MRKVFLPALFTLLSVLSVFSQDPVATLQHSGGTQVFYGINSLESAYQQSVDGDTIYLSVGSFSSPILSKRLTIIGAGYLPDSLSIKRATTILRGIMINTGATNLHLEGLYVAGNIEPSSNWANYDYLTVKRCRFTNIEFRGNGGFLYENIIEASITNCGADATIKHNIINGFISSIQRGIIEGNILLYSTSVFHTLSYVTIKNNVVMCTIRQFAYLNSCEAVNNIFITDVFSFYECLRENNNCEVRNNHVVYDKQEIFKAFTGTYFDFNHDYHLKTPNNFLGTDGTQVGIYGGLQPFKTSMQPSNPQIISKSVSVKTDNAGQLQVNFSVKAQDN